MPGYGVLGADEGEGLLPWSWATDRLTAAHDYWVSTVRPDGAPHAMAVWAIWDGDGLVFSTGGRSRKARNLAADPRCVVTTADATEPVIVQGSAERVTDADELTRLLAVYEAKYPGGWPDPADNPVLRVRAEVVFAMSSEGERFTTTPTRWDLTDGPA